MFYIQNIHKLFYGVKRNSGVKLSNTKRVFLTMHIVSHIPFFKMNQQFSQILSCRFKKLHTKIIRINRTIYMHNCLKNSSTNDFMGIKNYEIDFVKIIEYSRPKMHFQLFFTIIYIYYSKWWTKIFLNQYKWE